VVRIKFMIKKNIQKKGSVILIAVMVFTLVSLTTLVGSSAPVLKEVKITNEIGKSKSGYFLAESGVEDAVYRLKNSMNSGSSVITLGGNSAITDIVDTNEGKQIVSEGQNDSLFRRVGANLKTGEGVSFNYGLQVGSGGVSLSGSAGINGSVYSSGDISGSGSPFITGSAIAANSSALTADQINESPIPPSNNILFGSSSSNEDFAQSFVLNETGPLNKVAFYIKKTGNPNSPTVKIVSNNGSVPGTSVLDTATLNNTQVTTSYGWVEASFTSNTVLSAGITYWLVIDNGSNNSSKNYTIGGNSSYSYGLAKVGKMSGTWNNTSPSGLDGYFKLYTGGLTSTITGSYAQGLRIGSGGSSVAHAHTVNNSNINGSLYCQSGTGNNKNCNTSLPDPSSVGNTVSEGNINDWKDEALSGGTHSGNYSVGGSSTNTLGPKKINGNLTVNGSGQLIVSGTLWVTGNLVLNSSGKIKLAPSMGASSGVIIVDGTTVIDSSGTMLGSGTSGSYILLVSTSNCPTDSSCSGSNAVTVSGSAGSVVLVAENGTISFSGSASAKGVSARQVVMSGSAVVNYESGLINVNFSEGPSGGWEITGWSETE